MSGVLKAGWTGRDRMVGQQSGAAFNRLDRSSAHAIQAADFPSRSVGFRNTARPALVAPTAARCA